ncbi:MAG: ATP-dependent zinc metalloprotease FtsH [Planctomycetota bacterium]
MTRPNRPEPAPTTPAPAPWTLLLLAFGAVLISLFVWVPTGSAGVEDDFAAIRREVRDGNVQTLRIQSRELRIEGEFRGRALTSIGPSFQTYVATEDLLNELVHSAEAWNEAHPGLKTQIYVQPVASPYAIALIQLIPWLLFMGLIVWWWTRRAPRAGGGAKGRSRPPRVAPELPDVTFDDVAGIEEARAEVEEIVEFLRNPARFTRLGGRIPRGVLLVGPPGTGKTLLARAVAGEARIPFFSISGSDFVEMYVGVGAARVRDLFKRAREHSPCIIFLDEVDAVGRRRTSNSAGGSEEREQTLNAILVEMDGFSPESGVIVIAATNRPDILDPALLRPGRFDRQITVDLPDRAGRRMILEVHTRDVCIEEEVDLDALARGTASFSGAELAAIVNEGALIAALDGREKIGQADLEEARDKVRWGRARRSRVLEEEDRIITAYHEAGHAILAHLLPEVEPLHKVTIIPRGPSLGSTMQLPEKDRYSLTRERAFGMLLVLFGGRIAEQRFCGDISSGASSDLERASDLARRMVCEWGMSEQVGAISYSAGNGLDGAQLEPLGEETRRDIDKEIRRILQAAYDKAERKIDEHRDDVEAIARALLERETLDGAEVDELLAAPFDGSGVPALDS